MLGLIVCTPERRCRVDAPPRIEWKHDVLTTDEHNRASVSENVIPKGALHPHGSDSHPLDSRAGYPAARNQQAHGATATRSNAAPSGRQDADLTTRRPQPFHGSAMEAEPMATAPRVSVCVPVYNGDQFVGEAIDSILGQT